MNYSAEDISLLLSGGKDPSLSVAKQAYEILTEIVTPRVSLNCFRLDGRKLVGTDTVLEGEDIMRHLCGCDAVWILAATIGAEADKEIEKLKAGRLALAQAVDIGASIAVEALCDEKQNELSLNVKSRGKVLTPRFSCGYGDFPLSMQSEMLALTDAGRRIGITLGNDMTMHPFKSVTAVMGECMGFKGKPFECGDCAYKKVCSHKLCARQ